MGKNFINKGAFRLPLLLVILIAAGVGYFLWTRYGQELIRPPAPEAPRDIEISREKLPSPSPFPIATPKKTPAPLKQGKGTYNISQGSEVSGPRITQVSLDPLDPKKGEKQTISVKTFHTSPITQVKITLVSDNKTQTLPPLSLVSGTNLDGEWQVTWTVDDTVLYKYILTITSASSSGQSSVEVAPRQ